MRQAYHQSANTALAILKQGIDEARALLPDELRREHYDADRLSFTPWRDVEAWYRQQEHADPYVAAILTDLALLSDARAALVTVTTPTRTGPLDLTLARVRHS